MTVYALQKITVIGLQLRKECGKVMQNLTEKVMLIIVMIFGLMVFVNTALKKIIYTE